MQTQKDTGQMRMARDEDDVNLVYQQLIQFNPFGRDSSDLICISTNDVAPFEIKDDLLSAKNRDQKMIQRPHTESPLRKSY